MARVLYGSGISSFKGSIGGITFQQNKSGNIARLRPRTFKSVTAKQNDSINTFYQFVSGWKNLTQSQQEDWNDFSVLRAKEDMWGDAKILSGFNWFVSINYYRVLNSQSITASPPQVYSSTAVPNFNVVLSDTDITITFTSSWGDTYDVLLVYATYPVQNSLMPVRQALRLIKIDNAGPFSTFTITTEWEDYFNISYPPGQADSNFKVGIALRTLDNRTYIPTPASFMLSDAGPSAGGIGFMQIGVNFIVS